MKEKQAAGGVVVDKRSDGARRVMVVHRPRYDDWSFPKGGVHKGETFEQAALREVREETGLECRITGRLSSARYSYRTGKGIMRPKVVYYFLMEPAGGSFALEGDEVDRAEWLDFQDAKSKLSYRHDKEMLDSLISESAIRLKTDD